MSKYDFATMTREQALNACVELDVAKWGESQRKASEQHHARASRGLLINTIVHHAMNGWGEEFDLATKKLAKQQMTPEDKQVLRKGG